MFYLLPNDQYKRLFPLTWNRYFLYSFVVITVISELVYKLES